MSTGADYERVLGKAWDGVSNSSNMNVAPEEAVKFCKAYWKKHARMLATKPFPYTIKIGSGRRQTWVRGNVLTINPERGWKDINHAWSHWVAYRIGVEKNHCDQHLEMERDGAILIKDKFIKAASPHPDTIWLREYHPNGQSSPTYVRVKTYKEGDVKYLRA